MALYRKKPIDVEMYQWQPEVGIARLFSWASHARERGVVDAPLLAGPTVAFEGGLTFHCAKSQAEVLIAANDWVAIETDGSGFYPIDNAVQAVTYEPAD